MLRPILQRTKSTPLTPARLLPIVERRLDREADRRRRRVSGERRRIVNTVGGIRSAPRTQVERRARRNDRNDWDLEVLERDLADVIVLADVFVVLGLG